MPKMIDADKLLEWCDSEEAAPLWEGEDGLLKYGLLTDEIERLAADLTPPVQPDTPKHGDRVLHGIYGMGTVVSGVYVPAPTVIVDLDNSARFHPLPITDLEVITDEQR